MKKEVPPFGVLAADYDPSKHIIVRSVTHSKTERNPETKPKHASCHAEKHISEMAGASHYETKSSDHSSIKVVNNTLAAIKQKSANVPRGMTKAAY